ncbi:magnesium transporter CorA family protein [Candidatus Parcubacteria bacterium]|nr:magnesium transporter CorA family protein [Candidatus Parcubacteria bacterium]
MKRIVHQLAASKTSGLAPEVTWIDIQPPLQTSINSLAHAYRFDPFILNELLTPSLRAKAERYDHYLYLVLHFPVYDKKTRETHAHELDILATADTVITVHAKTILPLKAMFDKAALYESARDALMGRGAGILLYHLIETLIAALPPKVDHIAEKIDAIETEIFRGREREMISEISIVKRDILSFRRAIKPQKSLLESLTEIGPALYGASTLPYFRDLLGDYLRVWDHLETNHDMLNALEATNASLFSIKLSEIMKVLTIFAAILLPMSLVVGIFGVSLTHIPLKDEPEAFWLMLGSIGALGLIMLAVFRWKKWL